MDDLEHQGSNFWLHCVVSWEGIQAMQ
jgi:hypothetical protein